MGQLGMKLNMTLPLLNEEMHRAPRHAVLNAMVFVAFVTETVSKRLAMAFTNIVCAHNPRRG